MKEKIFQALKQVYPQLGLSDEIISSHANMLGATGLVTDENIDKIVALQKDYLQGIQSANDKRVNEAIIKATTKAENEKQDAITKAVADAIESERKKAEEHKKEENNVEPDYLDAFRKEFDEKYAKEREELNKKIEALLDSGKKQGETLKSLQAENEAMKESQAKAKREAFINDTAKALGIPEWRVNEGFVLGADADEDSIKTSLATIANNIKTAGLQGKGGLILDDNKKVTKDEIDDLVNGLLK